MQLQLQVVTGGHKGKLISIKHDKFLIGRSEECHLRPKSESISRRHCAIVRKDGNVLLIDLKSRNGTEVNGKMLDPSRAKILKNNDHIKVGKLEFVVVMEAGVKNVKKSEVKDVKDAAARSAGSAASDSRFEEVDVTSWLDEADQIQRSGSGGDTRQFQFEESSELSTDSTIMDAQVEQPTATEEEPKKAAKRPEKGKPGKLPQMAAKPLSGTSKDAASETLRKFFGGGR